MPQYASFNPSVAAPSPVTGWYDTTAFTYAKLPPAANLLEVTAAQWAARLANPSGWAVSAGALVPYTPPVPTPTLAQQAQAAILAGVQITSTGTPALSGTYACDPAAQAKIMATSLFAVVNSKFPGGGATMAWADRSGAVHTFPTIAEFQAFATAVGDYVAALDAVILGQSTTLPSQPVTIV